jgi:hypothetical protein
MRLRIASCAILLFAATASAQTARISGRVTDEGRGTPVSGATVRITGATAQVTDSLGRFQFAGVLPGRYIISVASIGYRLRTLEFTIGGDTTISIGMTRRVVSLDTMIVRPRYVRIKATAVDSASGDALMQAQATLYPGGRFIGARTGVFVFDSVPPGPVTIIVEGLEHLPARVELEVDRDTTFRVKMGVDSVFLRMVAMKVQQLKTRSMSVPRRVDALNRDAIMRQGATNLGELIGRRSFKGLVRPGTPLAGCEIVDEVEVVPGVVYFLLPELVERVEIYGSARTPSTIRVYTKRYVASLLGKETVPGVFFKGKGVTPVGCGGSWRP